MNTSSLTSASAISQYVTSLLARQQNGAAASASSTTDAVQARITAPPTDFKTTGAQHALDKQQLALGKDLSAGLSKAGEKLDGEVSFTLGSDGKFSVTGSDADQARVADFLARDGSQPSLQSRATSLLKSAQALSATTQQANAISLAARYGGASTNVMAMYTQFMGHQDATPATFTLSAAATSLHYPGALSSRA